MNTSDARSPSPPIFAHATPSAAIAEEWPSVRVERVELERGRPAAALSIVRTCIYLGRLRPVDVEAHVVLEGGPDASLPEDAAERMWSAHGYGNGYFIFEAHVPDAIVAPARRIRVRVHPAGAAPGERQVAAPVPTAELELSPAVSDLA